MTIKVTDLPVLFPAGEWSFNRDAYVVKVGQYWEVAAEVYETGVVLTSLGKSLSTPVKSPEAAAPEVKPAEPKPRHGKRAVALEDLDG